MLITTSPSARPKLAAMAGSWMAVTGPGGGRGSAARRIGDRGRGGRTPIRRGPGGGDGAGEGGEGEGASGEGRPIPRQAGRGRRRASQGGERPRTRRGREAKPRGREEGGRGRGEARPRPASGEARGEQPDAQGPNGGGGERGGGGGKDDALRMPGRGFILPDMQFGLGCALDLHCRPMARAVQRLAPTEAAQTAIGQGDPEAGEQHVAGCDFVDPGIEPVYEQ